MYIILSLCGQGHINSLYTTANFRDIFLCNTRYSCLITFTKSDWEEVYISISSPYLVRQAPKIKYNFVPDVEKDFTDWVQIDRYGNTENYLQCSEDYLKYWLKRRF